MENKSFSPDFQGVLQYCKENELYLGEGNPNAKILIIGKEQGMGAHKNKDANQEVSENSLKANLAMWHNIVYSNDLKKHEEYLDNRQKGKKYETLRNYQIIVDKIRKNNEPNQNDLDFYEDCFITEMSQIQLQSSDKTNNLEIERKESIEKRKLLFKQDFFQIFPIVIIACGHYVRDFDIDIQDIFNVEFIKPTITIPRNEKHLTCWYNVHYNKDYTTKGIEKTVIHTRQFSNKFNPELLSEIAELCKPFYN